MPLSLLASACAAIDPRDVLRGMLAQAAGQGNPLMTFGPIVLIVVIFYFFLIRPQSKQAKEHRAMLGALKKGDGVVTSGGVIGKVHSVADKFVFVEVAPSVRLRVLKSSISSKAPEGLLDEESRAESKDKAEEKK